MYKGSAARLCSLELTVQKITLDVFHLAREQILTIVDNRQK